MLKLFLFFLLLLPASVTYAASYEEDMDRCKELMKDNPAEVRIIYNFGDLKYDFSKTPAEISALAMKKSQNGTIQGLTEFSPHITIETLPDYKPLSNGRLCFYPQEIEVKIWYEPVVYIANTLEKGSCRYNITVRHEQTHLDIGHYQLLLLAQALKKQVPIILENSGPRIERKIDGVSDKFGEIYSQQIFGIYRIFEKALLQQNSVIDAPANYADEDKLCY